jgi:hypothetical protein
MGNARNKRGAARRAGVSGGAGKIGWTYRASALLFCAANLEIWQTRYAWVLLQFCVDNYEDLDCKRISTARGALDLRGMVGFFASTDCVTGLDKTDSIFPYFSFPWRVDSDGVAKESTWSRSTEFMRTEQGTEKVHKTRAAIRTTMAIAFYRISSVVNTSFHLSSPLLHVRNQHKARRAVSRKSQRWTVERIHGAFAAPSSCFLRHSLSSLHNSHPSSMAPPTWLR